MSEIVIEKGIPVPKTNRSDRRSKYPFGAMEVGDSFFVKNGNIRNMSRISSTHAKKMSYRFSCRTVDGGVRVWRTE